MGLNPSSIARKRKKNICHENLNLPLLVIKLLSAAYLYHHSVLLNSSTTKQFSVLPFFPYIPWLMKKNPHVDYRI